MKHHLPDPLQALVHIGGWLPLAWLAADALARNLTSNPIQAIEQRTGLVALTFLLLSLACTPLASIGGWKAVLRRRKALGLYGFMYASLHLLAFVGVDYTFDFGLIWADVGSKWYIIIGTTAFLLLVPLAVTSFRYWMKRLGKGWTRLHKLVYLIAPLVVVHFVLSVKGDFLRLQGNVGLPLVYGTVLALLLLLRVTPLKHALAQVRMRMMEKMRTAPKDSAGLPGRRSGG
ncbi:MAG: sulfoxide reductase heme-binding subunit YedZ [Chloroflexi bacterium]|nr:sulfoxide reductase heme-binding subunit YedZ [Chloroflexota bacterium]